MSKEEKLEVEVLFLVKVDSFDFMDGLEVETQEQYDLRAEGEGKGFRRERATTVAGNTKYEATVKVGVAGVKVETTIESNLESFELQRLAAQGHGWYKQRVRIPVADKTSLPEYLHDEELYWELDVYPAGGKGEYDSWVKIELELPCRTPEEQEALKNIKSLPALPIPYKEIIASADPSKRVEADKHFTRWNELAVSRFQSLENAEKSEQELEVSVESVRRLGTLVRRR